MIGKDKFLIVASVSSMIEQFNQNNIEILKNMGYEVHVATNFEYSTSKNNKDRKEFRDLLEGQGVKTHHLPFERGIGTLKSNRIVGKELKSLVQKYKYKAVHCHSPIGGVITRLVCKNQNIKVVYTAHGFQFFKNGPIKDWLLFYPVERYLSKYTDYLITINSEDFNLAKKLKCKNVFKVPGVGIDYNRFKDTDDNLRQIFRKKFNIPSDAFVIMSVGELSVRKNHQVIIKALNEIGNKNIYYFICGLGDEEKKIQSLINDYNLGDNIKLLGFQKNINELYKMADVSAFPSRREGLGLAGIEAMASGLPIITSNINGINDYSINGKTGYSVSPLAHKEFAKAILKFYNDKDLVVEIGKYNQSVSKKYDFTYVDKIMNDIYLKVSNGG